MHPNDIPIRIIHRNVEDGLLSGIATTAEVPLSEKLNDYIFRLGYSSAHITGIIIQLLTKGKVQVDFREYTERLELMDTRNRLTSVEAMTLLDNYLKEMQTPDDTGKKGGGSLTQRIVVQLPKGPKKR